MKYALIADIHANLEGLEVVLEDAQKNNCTHYVVWVMWWATTPTRLSA